VPVYLLFGRYSKTGAELVYAWERAEKHQRQVFFCLSMTLHPRLHKLLCAAS